MVVRKEEGHTGSGSFKENLKADFIVSDPLKKVIKIDLALGHTPESLYKLQPLL